MVLVRKDRKEIYLLEQHILVADGVSDRRADRNQSDGGV